MTAENLKKKDFQINRFLSSPLTRFLLKTPLTPNHVTWISLFFGVLAGCFFSNGTYLYSVAASFFLIIALVLDNCDGEIARTKKLGSVFGGWLDVFVDVLVDIALFAGLTVGALNQGIQGPVVQFGVLCIFGSLMNFILVVLEKIKGFGPAVFNKPHPTGTTRDNIFYKIMDALREGDSSWFVVIFALIGKAEYILWLAGIYMQILWISGFLLNVKWLSASSAHENH